MQESKVLMDGKVNIVIERGKGKGKKSFMSWLHCIRSYLGNDINLCYKCC